MKVIACLLALVAYVSARDLVTVDPGAPTGTATDLSETNLTRDFCEAVDKECQFPDIEDARYAPTARQCTIRCSQNVKCLSAHWDVEGVCHIRGDRCIPNNLKFVASEGTNYDRLMKGESCPSNLPKFEVPDLYSNAYCMWFGKVCKGHDLYPRPWIMATYEACLIKCTKLMTCSMVDFDASGKICNPKSYSCEDNELEDTSTGQNFVRMPHGVTQCPSNRGEPSPTAPAPTPAPEPGTSKPVPVQKPKCPANLKPFTRRVTSSASRKHIVAHCPVCYRMTVCHCKPYRKCDGARMSTKGECIVDLRTAGISAKAKAKARIHAFIKCEPYLTVSYTSSNEAGKAATCPAGTKRRDCTFYATGRNRKLKTLRTGKNKSCAPNKACGKGKCESWASCIGG